MKILVLPSFYPDPDNSNLGSFFKEQVKEFSSRGMNLEVIYVEQKSLHKLNLTQFLKYHFQTVIIKEKNWIELRVLGWKIPGLLGEKYWIYKTNKIVNNYIKNNGKPDLIHVHNVFNAGQVATKVKRKHNIPFVVTEHDSGFIMGNLTKRKLKIAQKVFQNANKVIAVSNRLREGILKILKTQNVIVIPNIVNTNYFKPGTITYASKNIFNFVSIGNLTRNKGHELLINAFAEVYKTHKNIRLQICGEGFEKKALIAQIKRLNLNEIIILSGHLPREKILKSLQKANCLIHPSYFETFGVVLIEALSCGIPFIATKSGGPEDIFKEGLGYIIDTGDFKLLSETIIDFIKNKDKFSIQNLRNYVVENYSSDSVYEKLNMIYSNLLNEN